MIQKFAEIERLLEEKDFHINKIKIEVLPDDEIIIGVE